MLFQKNDDQTENAEEKLIDKFNVKVFDDFGHLIEERIFEDQKSAFVFIDEQSALNHDTYLSRSKFLAG